MTRRKIFGGPIALIVAVAMVMTMFCGFSQTSTASAKGKTVKFGVMLSSKPSSGETGYVKGEVYSDYSGQLKIGGDAVSTTNAGIGIYMKDVASLGVSGEKNYSKNITFSGQGTDVSIESVKNAFGNFKDDAAINIAYGNASMKYIISKVDDSTYALTPSSVKSARIIWQALMKDVTTSKQDADDSYIVVGNGSSLQVGDKILQFEPGNTDNLKLDNFNDTKALDKTIRDAVRWGKADNSVDGISIKVAPGTQIAVKNSVATLDKTISMDVDTSTALTKDISDTLDALQAANKGQTVQVLQGLYDAFKQILSDAGGSESGIAISSDGENAPTDYVVDKSDTYLPVVAANAEAALNTNDYSAEKAAALQTAIDNANKVLAQDEMTAEEINKAKSDIYTAWKAAIDEQKAAAQQAEKEAKEAEEQAAKEAAEKAKQDAEKAAAEKAAASEASAKVTQLISLANRLSDVKRNVNKAVYTSASYENLKNAVDAAEAVLADENSTSAQLKNARKDVAIAENALKKKSANTMTVKGKTVKLKASKLKKKAQAIAKGKAYTIKKAQGKVTYKKVSVTNKKYFKTFTVNENTGKIKVKKGLKKGTYKVKVKISAAGNGNYNAAAKTVTVKVNVK